MLRTETPYDDETIQKELQEPEKEWADEGHKIATEFVYQIKENSVPDEKYVKEAQKIVHHRLALGGYRLAKILIDVYGKSDEHDGVLFLS